jgi:spore maturation protein SpmB
VTPQHAIESVSVWVIPALVVAAPIWGLAKKVPVYEAFTEGAKEGFQVAVRIIPYLVAILGAVGALKGAGAVDFLTTRIGPITERFGLPAVALPMLLIRPLSGSAANGVVASVLTDPHYGPDSYAGHLVSVMAGSTETTFYVLAVYCGAVGITRYRQALPAALFADLVGFVASIAVCSYVFR